MAATSGSGWGDGGSGGRRDQIAVLVGLCAQDRIDGFL